MSARQDTAQQFYTKVEALLDNARTRNFKAVKENIQQLNQCADKIKQQDKNAKETAQEQPEKVISKNNKALNEAIMNLITLFESDQTKLANINHSLAILDQWEAEQEKNEQANLCGKFKLRGKFKSCGKFKKNKLKNKLTLQWFAVIKSRIDVLLDEHYFLDDEQINQLSTCFKQLDELITRRIDNKSIDDYDFFAKQFYEWRRQLIAKLELAGENCTGEGIRQLIQQLEQTLNRIRPRIDPNHANVAEEIKNLIDGCIKYFPLVTVVAIALVAFFNLAFFWSNNIPVAITNLSVAQVLFSTLIFSVFCGLFVFLALMLAENLAKLKNWGRIIIFYIVFYALLFCFFYALYYLENYTFIVFFVTCIGFPFLLWIGSGERGKFFTGQGGELLASLFFYNFVAYLLSIGFFLLSIYGGGLFKEVNLDTAKAIPVIWKYVLYMFGLTAPLVLMFVWVKRDGLPKGFLGVMVFASVLISLITVLTLSGTSLLGSMYQVQKGVSLTLTEQAKERQISEIMLNDQQTECLNLIFESQDGNYYAKKCRNGYKTTWAYQQSQTYLIKKESIVEIQDYKIVVAKEKML